MKITVSQAQYTCFPIPVTGAEIGTYLSIVAEIVWHPHTNPSVPGVIGVDPPGTAVSEGQVHAVQPSVQQRATGEEDEEEGIQTDSHLLVSAVFTSYVAQLNTRLQLKLKQQNLNTPIQKPFHNGHLVVLITILMFIYDTADWTLISTN